MNIDYLHDNNELGIVWEIYKAQDLDGAVTDDSFHCGEARTTVVPILV